MIAAPFCFWNHVTLTQTASFMWNLRFHEIPPAVAYNVTHTHTHTHTHSLLMPMSCKQYATLLEHLPSRLCKNVSMQCTEIDGEWRKLLEGIFIICKLYLLLRIHLCVCVCVCVYGKRFCGFYKVAFFWHACRMNANSAHCACPRVKHSELQCR